MAHLTGSQKKKRNTFIALCVAIVLVVAAIALVVYNGITVAPFSNESLEKAVAESLDDKAGSLKKDDLAKVKYVEFVNVSDGQGGAQLAVTFGYDDFLTQLNAYNAEQTVITEAQTKYNEELDKLYEVEKTAAQALDENFDEEAFSKEFDEKEHDIDVVVPEAKVAYPEALAKMATASTSGSLTNMNDVKYFTGAKIVNLIGGKLDIKNLKGLKNLEELTITQCKLDNFEELAKLDYSKIKKITIDVACDGISENKLDALKPYGDKIYFAQYYDYGYGMILNAGEFSLNDYFAELEATNNAEQNPETTTEDETDETDETEGTEPEAENSENTEGEDLEDSEGELEAPADENTPADGGSEN